MRMNFQKTLAAFSAFTIALAMLPLFSQAFAKTDYDYFSLSRPKATMAIQRTDPVQKPDLGVFRSVAFPVGQLSAFGQWQSASAVSGPEETCWMGLCETRKGRQLLNVVQQARRLSPEGALNYINRRVNALISYRSDRGDHWASLSETAIRGVGDCEDYALAKRALLIGAGFDEDRIQFIVLKETRRQVYHAVIAVHLNGKRYILDNLSSSVMPDSIYRSYLPVASFAGGKTYLHGFTDSRAQLARGTDFSAVAPGDGQ